MKSAPLIQISHWIRDPRIWGGGVIFLLTSLFVLAFFPKILLDPGAYLLNDQGEAVRNYYTYAFQAEHGAEWLHFSGMQHPFGEHVVYTDGQPLLSGIFRILDGMMPGAAGSAIPFMNLLLLLSIPLGSVFLFWSFLRLGYALPLSMAFAIGLGLLNPQSSRIIWFYGLAYHFILPVVIWGLIRFQHAERRWSWTLFMIVFSLGCGLIHPYWLEIIGLCLGAYGVVEYFRSRPRDGKKMMQMMAQALVPILFFFLFLQLTDTFHHRNPKPWGFYTFNSAPEAIFLPQNIEGSIYQYFLPAEQFKPMAFWPGRGYIGILGNLALLSGLVLWIRFWWRRFRSGQAQQWWRRSQGPRKASIQDVFFWSSVAILPLAFALPFAWDASGEMLELFPFLHQFRHTGRLVWLFYFAVGFVTMGMVGRLEKWLADKMNGGNWLPSVLAGLCCLIMVGEARHNYHTNLKLGDTVPNPFSEQVLGEAPQYAGLQAALTAYESDPETYQAIVPLPWYHKGTEAFTPPSQAGFDMYNWSMTFSYHSGLPMTASYLPRSSLKEAESLFAFYDQSRNPGILEEAYSSDQPLLLFRMLNRGLTPEEEALVEIGEEFFRSEELVLYRLWPKQIWERSVPEDKVTFWENAQLDLIDRMDHWSNDSASLIYRENFDGLDHDRTAFHGLASLSADFQDTTAILDFDSIEKMLEPGQGYQVSFWFNAMENRTRSQLYLGNEQAAKSIPQIFQSFVLRNGWIRCQWKFTATSELKGKSLFFHGEDYAQTIMVDDVLVWKEGTFVYEPNIRNGELLELMVNNFPIGQGLGMSFW